MSFYICYWKYSIEVSDYDCWIVCFSYFSFKFCRCFCFMYFGGCDLGVYMLVLFSSWIDPFIIINCPSLSLWTTFVLKSVLPDTSITFPTSSWVLFAWDMFFHDLNVPFLSLLLGHAQQWLHVFAPRVHQLTPASMATIPGEQPSPCSSCCHSFWALDPEAPPPLCILRL